MGSKRDYCRAGVEEIPRVLMKQSLFVFCLLAGLTAVSQQTYTIKAFLPEWNGGSIILTNNDVKVGSGRITGDVFSFTAQIKNAGFGALHISKEGKNLVFPFFIEAGTISIRAGSVYKLFAFGTPLNDAYKKFQERTDSLALFYTLPEFKNTRREIAAGLIKNDPGSLLSLRLLKDLFYLDPSANDSVYYSLYRMIADSLKETSIGKKIGEESSVRFYTSPGKNSPEIVLPDVNDMPAFVYAPGKVTIIHFWASWCLPCKRELLELKKTLVKYKDRDLQVVTVSLDKDLAAWKRSIEPASMNWKQLLDRKAFEGEAAKLFGVKNIPANFLIDSNGKIMARHINVTEIENLISEFHD
jgi:thiol-disulfide isomerase/thioredoxin